MYLHSLTKKVKENDLIGLEQYNKFLVKKGLREDNGEGVLVGLTNISSIKGHTKDENGNIVPIDGKMTYRNKDIFEIVDYLSKNNEFGFEAVAFLLLFGTWPTKDDKKEIKKIFAEERELPVGFISNVLLSSPTDNIMSQISKALLALSAYDKNLKNLSVENVLIQCLHIVSILPRFAVYSYLSHNYFNNGKSLYIHYHNEKLTLPENFLQMLRLDGKFTKLEAQLLDLCLILQMEHGGGNNSTFTTRVVTSSGADTYMTMTAALSSLSGTKHGGANLKVVQMINDLKEKVKDTNNRLQIRDYLVKVINKKAFDKQGLIYGIGHAVYTKSDPRATILKQFAQKLAVEKNREYEFELYNTVAETALEILEEKSNKPLSINVDFYIGFVYSTLNIPEELFTPLFAIARSVGWSAHRLEELVNSGKIIRPSYEYIEK